VHHNLLAYRFSDFSSKLWCFSAVWGPVKPVFHILDPLQIVHAVCITDLNSLLPTYADRNKDQFEKEVYGPLFLELEVENAQDSRMVDAALGNNAYRFLCQTQKDFDTFHKLMTTDRDMGNIAKSINLINASKVKRWAPIGEKIENLRSASCMHPRMCHVEHVPSPHVSC